MIILEKEKRTSLIQISKGKIIQNNTEEFTERHSRLSQDIIEGSAKGNSKYFIFQIQLTII